MSIVGGSRGLRVEILLRRNIYLWQTSEKREKTMSDDQPRRGCLWPMWPHDARPNHQYCGAQQSPESSYCAEHRRQSIRNLDEEPRQRFIPRKIAA